MPVPGNKRRGQQKLNIQHNEQYSSNFILLGRYCGKQRIALISIILTSVCSSNLSFFFFATGEHVKVRVFKVGKIFKLTHSSPFNVYS
jgi:hypothetical protein